jgi:hypothetical protein
VSRHSTAVIIVVVSSSVPFEVLEERAASGFLLDPLKDVNGYDPN